MLNVKHFNKNLKIKQISVTSSSFEVEEQKETLDRLSIKKLTGKLLLNFSLGSITLSLKTEFIVTNVLLHPVKQETDANNEN